MNDILQSGFAGACGALAGELYRRWRLRRKAGPQWTCPNCKNKGKTFQISCNDKRIFHRMKADHLLTFHITDLDPTLTEN